MGFNQTYSTLMACLAFLILTSNICNTYAKSTVPAAYVFGDSLVDLGNNNYITTTLKANFWFNGIDYTDSTATGRYSNGKNIADFLAEKLGLETSPPYLSLSADNTSAYLAGVSFGSGGAGIFNTTNSEQCMSLDEQISNYTVVYGNLVRQLGTPKTQLHLSNSVFLVVIGSNDIKNYFASNSTNPLFEQYVNSLVATLRGQLKALYNLGARKFIVFGTGPIGCVPSMRINNGTNCYTDANYISTLYNKGVPSLLADLSTQLGNFTYSFFDTYSVVSKYIQQPEKYGLVEVKAACCGLGELYADAPCSPISVYCSNRSDHLFWDAYGHTTEIVDEMIAKVAFEGSAPFVYPLNIKQITTSKGVVVQVQHLRIIIFLVCLLTYFGF